MKFKDSFNRDFSFYLSVRNTYNFDGVSEYFNKKGEHIVQYDKNGISGKQAFYWFDSNGLIKPTKHPNILKTLLKVKGSVNLHIKLYAEDRAKGILTRPELIEICKQYNAPEWFWSAVETQKYKY